MRTKAVVIRLTDETSITPLTDNGFTASHPLFEPSPSDAQWKRDYKQHNANCLRDSPDAREGIVRHISSGWGYDSTAASPWISTTLSLDWAIWEAARRLAKLDIDWVDMSLIKLEWTYNESYRGNRAIWIDPYPLIKHYESEELHDRAATAFAKSSSEILAYGRIFKKDIIMTLEWSLDHTPFCLPAYCFRPFERWPPPQGWLDKLVWDPCSDSFSEARKKMRKRSQHLSKFRTNE
ncbi:hypothetical protein I316_04871 [Kwoniella heveanensis BCC8398]|uniref:DUF7587 domain-containing protein n=1 Tax=Kwoniella heveanensis BCC8398 TaxID=1296120 RepID=A0A1B9GQZ7_9TREE|nr:hypothetical protein I316_04871 [Kwoniella heveanensis BCC8398]